MKKTNFLLVLFLSLASYLIFSSRSSGAGFNSLGDLTGSPVSGGTCANCHGGGNFGASVTIRLLDGSNNPVTSYVPGQSYVMEVDVNNSSGSPAGFGAQAVALTSTNNNAGTMGTVITGNTRTLTISGRSYMEQSSVSANGLFRVNWTAPAAGTGNVAIYAVGNVVNGVGTSGDQVITGNVSITEAVPTTISYNQSNYCQNGTNPNPTITGNTGGTFSSGVGLAIASGTGVINLAASTPGNYTVTYTYPGGSTTTDVTINLLDQATVSYGSNQYCVNQSPVSPGITGVQNGVFSSTPSGLSINTNSGIIDPLLSTPGNYTVSFTTSGNCPTTATVNVTINALDVANINYGNNPSFCVNQSQVITPNITGVQNGTFSSSAGLSINSSTGEIDPSASTAGVYNVNFTTNGICPTTTNASVTINNQDIATINYGANPSFCSSVTSVSPNFTGSTGSFSGSAGLNINNITGEIFPVSSSVGSYSVNFISGGICPDTATTSLAIIQTDDAQFTYSGGTFCTSGSNAVPTTPVSSGGSFSSSPAGLDLDVINGIITVANSTTGNYTITYTTFSPACPDTHSVSVQITNAGSAAFSYSQNNFCSTGPNPLPVISGLGGGVFSSIAGLAISPNDGQINVGSSLEGTYTVYYNVAGSCPASDSTTISITQSDIAVVSYNGLDNSVYFSTSLGDSVYLFGCIPATSAPIINGVTGGAFTTIGSVNLDASSGVVNSQNFSPTLIVYTTNGICPTSDSFYVESVCVSGLTNVEHNSNINIYPNPSFDGNFKIKNTHETTSATVEIYNHLGQKIEVKQMTLQSGVEQVLNIFESTSGFYIIKIKTGKGEWSHKLFVD